MRQFVRPFLLLASTLTLRADPPVLTEDPETPKAGHWEIFVGTAAEKRDGVWLQSTPHVEIEYGLLDNLMLKYEQSWLVEFTDHQPTHTGLGDALTGVKWRFLDDEKSGLSASFYPQVSFNSSSRSVALGLSDPGSQLILPVELQWEHEANTIFGEVGYTWRQHSGDGLIYGIVFERKFTDKLSLLLEIQGESTIRFLEGQLMGNLGFQYQLSEHCALVGSAGTAVLEGNKSAPDFIGYLGMQFKL